MKFTVPRKSDFAEQVRLSDTSQLEGNTPQVNSIENKAGIRGRLSAGRLVRKDAARALADIRRQQVEALRDIQKTSTAVATATVKAAIVAEAMPALATLNIRLNMATGSADQALTNSGVAENVAHFKNRQSNLDMLQELQSSGAISAEEVDLVRDQIFTETYNDMNRTIDRQNLAKDSIAAIHEYGIAHIQRAKDGV